MGVPITLAQYLVDQDIAYEVVPHPHSETALDSATAAGVTADRVVKAVVILEGEGGFMLALLPASHRIQFDELRRLLGDHVDIAGEEKVETLFVDCEPGAVPALGAAYGLDVVIDDSLAEQRELYLESGDHASLVHISGQNFRKLMAGARHGRFTAHA